MSQTPPGPNWLDRLTLLARAAWASLDFQIRRQLRHLTARLDEFGQQLASLESPGEAINWALNSNWMYGLTQTGAVRRRLIVIGAGAFLWAFFAYLAYPPTWDVRNNIEFFTYPLRALFNLAVFPLVVLLSLLFQLLLWSMLIFVRNLRRETLRLYSRILALMLSFLWALLALQFTRPDWDPDFPPQLVAYPFEALFSVEIIRHVIIAGMAFWLGYRLAAYYLNDIYELGDLTIAERFILQAVFGSQYNTINIKDGDLAQSDKESHIIQIGGPGFVRVHLNNAAMFEKIDGTSRVIGPTVESPNEVEQLAGFERLRTVVDLNDQTEELTVEGRTLDGIRVKLEGVTVVFSIYRAYQFPTLAHPYPFNPDSIRRLVYSNPANPLKATLENMVRREFSNFIARHTLSEFLAAIGAPEQEEFLKEEVELLEKAAVLAGDNPGAPPDVQEPNQFFSRPDIMTQLFASEFRLRAAQRGIDIRWIGGGTWVTPDEIVPNRHQEAWRISRENLLRGSERAIREIHRQSRLAETIHLVQEVPVMVARQARPGPAMEVFRKVVIAYRKKLSEAYETMERLPDADAEEKARLKQVLDYLARFTARWLGGRSNAG